MRRLTVGLLLVSAAAVAMVVVPGRTRAAGPHSFPHAAHLSPAAIATGLALAPSVGLPNGAGATAAGSDAECRVCHDYARGEDAHLEACAGCHQGPRHLVIEAAPAERPGRRPFPHAAHLRDPALTCLSCHPMQREADWIGFGMPAPGLGGAGLGGPGTEAGVSCADCHALHEPRGGRVIQDERTGDGRACATCHQGATSILARRHRAGSGAVAAASARPFRHADHGASGAACEDCHAGVRSSRSIRDYDSSADTAARCNACHVADATGTPLVRVSATPRATAPSDVRFARFSHADHMVPAGELETSGAVTDGCRTCHYPFADPRAAALFPARGAATEPVGRAQLIDYRACLPCHAAWTVSQHGVGEWACFKCHTDQADVEGRLLPRRADVVRSALDTIAFGVHGHPGVTTTGPELDDPSQPDGKTCEDCHVSRRETLLSRLQDRTFDHASHVGSDATSTECTACHDGSSTAPTSEELARFDARVLRPAGERSDKDAARGCLDCHIGARPEDIGLRAVERTVAEFDHRAHVTTAALPGAQPGIPCATCHEPGGDTGFHVPEDVADCKRCHSHDTAQPEQFARTGQGSTPAEARLCVHCHGADPDAPVSAEVRTTGARVHLDLSPGKQWHDLSGDCSVCHERDRFAGQPARYRERIRSARVISAIHTDAALAGAWFNDPRIAEPGGDPAGLGRTCTTCHRSEPPAYLRELER